MMRPRPLSTWFYLVLLLLLLLPAAPSPTAAQTALAETWIAFTSLAPGEEGIWVVHPDGTGLGRLTEGRDLYPTWSPDGTLLAYVHEISGTLLDAQIVGYNSEIRVVDTAGRIRYTIGRDTWVEGEAATPLPGSVGLPAWSSDGQALSYGVNLEYFFMVGWGGRRTFYLDSPRIEVGRGPYGSLLAEGTILGDQCWGPGPVPTWVQASADLTTYQLIAYDRQLQATTGELFLNPRWSPGGQSLTVYRQKTQPDYFYNALQQISATGAVERTLFESNDLYLYTIAEPSPDGERHLIGISSDASGWFGQIVGSKLRTLGPASVLPQEPPPTGYLYVLDQAGSRTVVAQPQRGTVDLVSRQPWSPDGSQVVFMRAPHPAAEEPATTGLGVYIGAPGQARRLVPFSAIQESFELTLAYPAWQPVPQGPLPTMVPLAPVGAEPTAAPTPAATTPASAATSTRTPPATETASPTPTPTPSPRTTAVPTPAAPAAPQSNLRTYLLIGIGLVVLGLVAVIAWMLLQPERPAGEASFRRLSDFLARLFRSRRAGGESTARSPFRPLLRRSGPSGEAKSRTAGSLLRRPPQPMGESAPKKRFALFSRRPKPPVGEDAPKKRFALFSRRPKPAPVPSLESAAEPVPAAPEELATEPAPTPATPKKRFALFSRRPKPASTAPVEPAAEPASASIASAEDKISAEAAFPSLRARREGPVDWPDTDSRPAPTVLVEPPSNPPTPGPAAALQPAPSPPAAGEVVAAAPPPSLSPEQELLRQGIAQVRAGQSVAGMATLQKVIQRTPEEGAAWLWLGWAAARQNQRVLAERCFMRAQELGIGEAAEQALGWLRGR